MATVQRRRTLEELRGAVRLRAALQATDTSVTYDVLDDAINSALRQVSTENNWPWLLDSQTISTVAGTEAYEVETDWLATDSVSIGSNAELLKHVNKKRLLEIPTTAQGRPTLYAVRGESIILRTVPDAVYTLTHWFYRMEPILAGDLAKPLIPYGYDEGVVEYATYLVLRYKREEARARAAQDAYLGWLQRTRDNLAESTEPRAPRVRRGSEL